jgi:hypothetical protein
LRFFVTLVLPPVPDGRAISAPKDQQAILSSQTFIPEGANEPESSPPTAQIDVRVTTGHSRRIGRCPLFPRKRGEASAYNVASPSTFPTAHCKHVTLEQSLWKVLGLRSIETSL